MTLKYFIDRPILSTVISVGMVLMGALALFTLPVEQYPDIAPPTVAVYTNSLEPTPRPCRKRSSCHWRKPSTEWRE